jgi:hypothetical protein
VRYEAYFWPEIQSVLRSLVLLKPGASPEVDIGYCSLDLFDRILTASGTSNDPIRATVGESIEFRPLKTEVTRLCALRRMGESGTAPQVLNFQGYYPVGAVGRHEVVYMKHWGEAFCAGVKDPSASSMGLSGVFNYEHLFLLCLAAGVFPRNWVVIPSLQGYAWLTELGFVGPDMRNAGTGMQLGSLSSDALNHLAGSRPTPMHLFVRKVGAKPDMAGDLCTLLVETAKRMRENLARKFAGAAGPTIVREISDQYEEAAAALLAPLFKAQPDYDGLLTMLPPSLMVRLLVDFYEKEVDYQPEWWEHARRALTPTSPRAGEAVTPRVGTSR